MEDKPGLAGPAHTPVPVLLSPTDDANSYENVLICKQKTTEPGEAAQPGPPWPLHSPLLKGRPHFETKGSQIPGYLWVEPCP